MMEGLKPDDPVEGSAYGEAFSLHRHINVATEALKASNAMRSMLGEGFVDLYCALKDDEFKEFQEIITPWEREILMFNV
jgi:glutamine synthetase